MRTTADLCAHTHNTTSAPPQSVPLLSRCLLPSHPCIPLLDQLKMRNPLILTLFSCLLFLSRRGLAAIGAQECGAGQQARPRLREPARRDEQYVLDIEYSGQTFFNGYVSHLLLYSTRRWDFFNAPGKSSHPAALHRHYAELRKIHRMAVSCDRR